MSGQAAQPMDAFAAIDRNHDGVISREEFYASMQQGAGAVGMPHPGGMSYGAPPTVIAGGVPPTMFGGAPPTMMAGGVPPTMFGGAPPTIIGGAPPPTMMGGMHGQVPMEPVAVPPGHDGMAMGGSVGAPTIYSAPQTMFASQGGAEPQPGQHPGQPGQPVPVTMMGQHPMPGMGGMPRQHMVMPGQPMMHPHMQMQPQLPPTTVVADPVYAAAAPQAPMPQVMFGAPQHTQMQVPMEPGVHGFPSASMAAPPGHPQMVYGGPPQGEILHHPPIVVQHPPQHMSSVGAMQGVFQQPPPVISHMPPPQQHLPPTTVVGETVYMTAPPEQAHGAFMHQQPTIVSRPSMPQNPSFVPPIVQEPGQFAPQVYGAPGAPAPIYLPHQGEYQVAPAVYMQGPQQPIQIEVPPPVTTGVAPPIYSIVETAPPITTAVQPPVVGVDVAAPITTAVQHHHMAPQEPVAPPQVQYTYAAAPQQAMPQHMQPSYIQGQPQYIQGPPQIMQQQGSLVPPPQFSHAPPVYHTAPAAGPPQVAPPVYMTAPAAEAGAPVMYEAGPPQVTYGQPQVAPSVYMTGPAEGFGAQGHPGQITYAAPQQQAAFAGGQPITTIVDGQPQQFYQAPQTVMQQHQPGVPMEPVATMMPGQQGAVMGGYAAAPTMYSAPQTVYMHQDQHGGDMFQQLDTNHDGVLSREEFMHAMHPGQ